MSEGLANAVQIAVFGALSGSAELDGLLASHNREARSAIYGVMPNPSDSGDNSLFPLITIGEDRVNDWSTDTASGGEVAVMVHVWSRAAGWREAKQISAAIHNVLHRAELTTPDHEFIGLEFENDECMRDPDATTLHIASQYRLWLDEEGYGG